MKTKFIAVLSLSLLVSLSTVDASQKVCIKTNEGKNLCGLAVKETSKQACIRVGKDKQKCGNKITKGQQKATGKTVSKKGEQESHASKKTTRDDDSHPTKSTQHVTKGKTAQKTLTPAQKKKLLEQKKKKLEEQKAKSEKEKAEKEALAKTNALKKECSEPLTRDDLLEDPSEYYTTRVKCKEVEGFNPGVNRKVALELVKEGIFSVDPKKDPALDIEIKTLLKKDKTFKKVENGDGTYTLEEVGETAPEKEGGKEKPGSADDKKAEALKKECGTPLKPRKLAQEPELYYELLDKCDGIEGFKEEENRNVAFDLVLDGDLTVDKKSDFELNRKVQKFLSSNEGEEYEQVNGKGGTYTLKRNVGAKKTEAEVKEKAGSAEDKKEEALKKECTSKQSLGKAVKNPTLYYKLFDQCPDAVKEFDDAKQEELREEAFAFVKRGSFKVDPQGSDPDLDNKVLDFLDSDEGAGFEKVEDKNGSYTLKKAKPTTGGETKQTTTPPQTTTTTPPQQHVAGGRRR